MVNCGFERLLIIIIATLLLCPLPNTEARPFNRDVISKNEFWRDCDLGLKDILNIVVQNQAFRIPFGYLPISEEWKYHLCRDKNYKFYNKLTPPEIDIDLKNGGAVRNYARFLSVLLESEKNRKIVRVTIFSELVNFKGFDAIGGQLNPWLDVRNCYRLGNNDDSTVDLSNSKSAKNIAECSHYKSINDTIFMRLRSCDFEDPIVCTIDFYDLNRQLLRIVVKRDDIPMARANILNIINFFQSWKSE